VGRGREGRKRGAGASEEPMLQKIKLYDTCDGMHACREEIYLPSPEEGSFATYSGNTMHCWDEPRHELVTRRLGRQAGIQTHPSHPITLIRQ